MSKKIPMSLYFTETQLSKLKSLADEKMMTMPEYIKRHLISTGMPKIDPINQNGRDTTPYKISISLPVFIIEEIAKRAKDIEMAKSRYIGALIQSQITDKPVFTDKEIAELTNCNQHLWKIGININQVAHHFNAAKKIGNMPNHDLLKIEALAELKKEINASRKAIRELIRASRGVWGVKSSQ